ncbi:uncharacterized protein LOC126656106 [Mercurialis annua]|uniref:uncharacterized protein LOC126656106 n=1 Tax=Mercurialis annua TaxID=3986 RepID=UPI00215DFF37|nr:uncharacterized protein LOC126656106 [Mercurialis annua]
MAETGISDATTKSTEQQEQKPKMEPEDDQISEASENTESPAEEPIKFDPETMRTTKPKLKRLFLTLTVLFSFVLGLPFLWKSVEIYRSSLPFDDMEKLSNEIQSNPLPLHFQAVFIASPNPNLNRHTLHSSLSSQITKLTSQQQQQTNNDANFTLSVSICNADDHNLSSLCGALAAVDLKFGDDESVDEVLQSVLSDSRVYTVVVHVTGEEGVTVVVGKYRHAVVVVGKEVDIEEAAVVERIAEVFVNVFGNGGRDEGFVHEEFMPVGSDGRIVLSFNLLNSNPHDWIYDWDFQRIDETLLAPVIEALAPIANISVESQVLYHTPKSTYSSWDDKLDSYVFNVNDLPFFVNSNEWHLDTSTAAGGRSKILQFVVYVPSADECPLLLKLPNGQVSATNGFISPMWGGVTVWNSPSCSKDSEGELPERHMISTQELQKIFEVFMGQFRQLFGLKSGSIYVGAYGSYNLLSSERGFTQWELDVLSRQHTYFNLHSSATTLGSLSRLVQSLPRMIITDEIGKQVTFSLESAKLAQSNASLGVYDASAVSSRQARSLAEDAFFHPSIMSVSYYSFEHCFAVYSPFFLPVTMHVVLAAVRELSRYKKENAKYLFWKAKGEPAL